MATRGGFSNRLGFVAAAAGSAVGLGNIWRFPYETGDNGGAAFLLIYILCAVLIGLPLIIAEISVGRAAQKDAYGTFTALGNKHWGLVGLLGILVGTMFLSFYNVIAGWAFGYFYQITFGDLLQADSFSAYFGAFASDISDNLIFSLVFMFLTAFIVARGVKRGIELASKILMPLLLIILLGLIIYGMTLENASEGLKFYLIPDFSQITAKTVYTAMGQAFFSLSLGMGALITYGSYFSKTDNIISAAAIVTFVDLLVAFLAGLMIFPLVFSQGQAPTEGPGLVFVALPGIFQNMGPLLGKMVGGTFFLLLCFAALTSTISLLEIPVAYLVDQKGMRRNRVVYVMAAIIFIIGIPSMLSMGAVDFFTDMLYYEGRSKSFLDLITDTFSDLGLPLGGFLLTLFISVRWKKHRLSDELEQGNPGFKGSLTEKFLHAMVGYFCPVILGSIFVISVLQKFFGVNIF